MCFLAGLLAGWQTSRTCCFSLCPGMRPLSLISSLGSSRDPSQPQVGAAERWHRDTSTLGSLLPTPDLGSSEASALGASLDTGIAAHLGLFCWHTAPRWSHTPEEVTFRRCCCNSMAEKQYLSFLQMSAPGGNQNDLFQNKKMWIWKPRVFQRLIWIAKLLNPSGTVEDSQGHPECTLFSLIFFSIMS